MDYPYPRRTFQVLDDTVVTEIGDSRDAKVDQLNDIIDWKKGSVLEIVVQFKPVTVDLKSQVNGRIGKQSHNILGARIVSSSTVMSLSWSERDFEFKTWYSDCPTMGTRISARDLAILQPMKPVKSTIGRSGVPSLWILGLPYIRGIFLVGYTNCLSSFVIFSSFSSLCKMLTQFFIVYGCGIFIQFFISVSVKKKSTHVFIIFRFFQDNRGYTLVSSKDHDGRFLLKLLIIACLSSLEMLDGGGFADFKVPTISERSCSASDLGNFQQAFSHPTMYSSTIEESCTLSGLTV